MENLKIAVLIDGDNANHKNIEATLAMIKEHGELSIKKIYGDWSQPQLSCWKSTVNKNSIKAVQTFNYTKGKNSTDTALIIDAMDILHSGKINAFCIVSSDCDFTGLVHRIKEAGLFTIGLGNTSACSSFKDACDLFLTERKLLDTEPEPEKKAQSDLKKHSEIFRHTTRPLLGVKVLGKIDLEKIKK
ncbi:MAG TPA: NYN domain-containing protein [Bacteroidia bacterium]|nr:NYN domain-containing protein [Bacteroidia bacterium]HRH08446.1 NYN domain-containing protein [Bacteroidia bacterium]